DEPVYRIELLMKKANISVSDRPVVAAANIKSDQTGNPAAAMEMPDGTILTGKTSPLLGASSSLLLNALKFQAGIDDSIDLLPSQVIEPIMETKVKHLGGDETSLMHLNELLIALSVAAVTDENARKALDHLHDLEGLEAHSSVILSHIDSDVFKKLGINLTCEPRYEGKQLYHK
ncbi:MAG: DUF1846 family protein, partial [Eubacterium sp.]|nr:DUF1846 family protein [Eubacterium sp.]